MRSYKPEEFLRANEVSSPREILQYAGQQIGCPKPIGHKKRGMLYKRIKEELQEQRWTYRHLTSAIDFMKKRGIKAKSFDYIFYHVEPAIQAGFMPRAATDNHDALQEAVARAVYLETDEDWTRRLLAARGSSLARVYQMWVKERQPLLEDT